MRTPNWQRKWEYIEEVNGEIDEIKRKLRKLKDLSEDLHKQIEKKKILILKLKRCKPSEIPENLRMWK